MGRSTFKTGAPSDRRHDVEFPTGTQAGRQLGVIAVIVLVWSLLLAGYVSLSGEPAKEVVSEAPPPTEAATATATTAAPSPTETATRASATATDEEPSPTASEPAEEAPSATSPPPPTTTPPPEPTDPPPAPEPAVSFAENVLPIFESRCVQCHGESRISGGLRLDSYQAATAASESGPSIVPGDAAQSLLVDLIVSGDMPRRGPTLTPVEIQTITDWVNGGALDN
jgi:hypothetical protein